MIFCGGTFCGALKTLDYTPSDVKNIQSVELQNGIYDRLHIDTNTSKDYTTDIPEDWEYSTIFDAHFDGNLSAGNVNFILNEVNSLLIKREEDGTGKWITLFEVPINEESDFAFVKLDKTVRANTKYNYALIPVIAGQEGEMNISSILCEFEGIFIMEKDVTYHALANISMTMQKNRPSVTVNTIDRKYPYVVTNGNNNYTSGSTSATFIKTVKDDYDWQWYDSYKYREDLYNFLCDGNPKILKHFDGRMYLISIIDNPTQNEAASNYFPVTTFNWVEIGDAENTDDLYNNNIIDYNSRQTSTIERGVYNVL